MSATLQDVVGPLRKTFSGRMMLPHDPEYESARRVHNGLIDKRPAVIARCHGVADVIDAVRLGRDQGLEIAVRGGGHNVAGRSTVEGGMMIDLSGMAAVQVDPARRIARAQGGATWGGFNRETQVHGLATTGGVISSTGVGGLTLGGGIGWLMGKHALALDNLLAVDLVTAEGRAVTTSREENPDLFWGVRGGGGNFGVATTLTYQLHAVGPYVTGGVLAYPFEAAWDVMRFYRDITNRLPDEFVAFGGFLHSPDGTKLVALVVCHCGTPEAGERAMQPIKDFGRPAMDAIGPVTYTQMNTMLDDAYPRGALNYWKSNFLPELSDTAIRTMIDCYAACPMPMGGLLLEHFHGAVTRIGVEETAFPHRSPGYNLLVLGQWTDQKDNERCIAWTRDTYAALQPYMGENRYVNYLGDDDQLDAVKAAYGPNFARLLQVKAKYDPANVFRMNHNIRAPSPSGV